MRLDRIHGHIEFSVEETYHKLCSITESQPSSLMITLEQNIYFVFMDDYT
jgi:hypothetical protein